jgi:MraZ protein
VDDKGRFLFPAGLRKQLDPSANETFMINRGFESCLTLYPMNEWEKISKRLSKLNLFKAENRKFYRYFHNGANSLLLDNAGRLLLPKPLMSYAGISRELIAFAYANRIELWDKAAYQRMMEEGGDDFADLAEQVMGDVDMGDDE